VGERLRDKWNSLEIKGSLPLLNIMIIIGNVPGAYILRLND